MKFLLTSGGISNDSIRTALVDLLGKPITESSALVIPTAWYAYPGGLAGVYQLIHGVAKSPFCELGWKSLGVLELTALPTIKQENWVPLVQEVDALLVGGGEVFYLCYWMWQSGLADLLPTLRREAVYVGLSGGSMVVTPPSESTTTLNWPPAATECWDWLTLRCFRTWITLICRTIPWPTQKNGPPGYQYRRMRSTIRPPSL